MTTIKHILSDQYPDSIKDRPPDNAYKLRTKGEPRIFSMDEIYKAVKHRNKRPNRHKPPIFKLLKNGVHCDDLVVLRIDGPKETGFYVIERKTNPPMRVLDKIKEQLQAGVHFIDDFIDNHRELKEERFDFQPVLVSNRINNQHFRRELIAKKITSRRSKSKRIKHVITKEYLPEWSN